MNIKSNGQILNRCLFGFSCTLASNCKVHLYWMLTLQLYLGKVIRNQMICEASSRTTGTFTNYSIAIYKNFKLKFQLCDLHNVPGLRIYLRLCG